jgi:hypothetical protein
MANIDMGEAERVAVEGCAVMVDGTEVDSWSAATQTARAGRQIWRLTTEQVAILGTSPAASFTRTDHPMRGFHR